MKDVLLVFARYPRPGECKTRLIPELGAEGAAELHESMTRWALAWARKLGERRGSVTEVHFVGADSDAMASKFGNETYVEQSDGDLGQRMKDAVLRRFGTGASRILIVGTDCPELNDEIAFQAFERLATHEVCIAPATDGGYTLVGIASQSPERLAVVLEALFSGLDWGTESVLQQTLRQLAESNISLSLLPTLADVDTPQDLERGMQALKGDPKQRPHITVIIPVHGVEERLALVLRSAHRATDVEVIVSASSSPSSLPEIAVESAAQLIYTRANRGHQLNTAAESACGDVLLFLHADTELPPDYREQILNVLEDSRTVGGAFSLRIDSERPSMRIIEKGVELRSRLLRMPYGDQAIFVRSSVFKAMGGFREQPIMEDYDFVRRLKREGRIAVLSSSVKTSARRWERLGPVRTTLKNQMVILGFYLGISPERLAQFYREKISQRAN